MHMIRCQQCTVNNVTREHPPSIRGHRPGDVLNISGSLLSENAAHAQHTRHKVLSYFRPDLVGKLIVFYIDDYTLFRRALPEWIEPFCNVEALRKRMDALLELYVRWEGMHQVVGSNHSNLSLLLLEEERVLFMGNESEREGQDPRDFIKRVYPDNLLTFGMTSIWHIATHDGERRNRTSRDQALGDPLRQNTKIKCFDEMLQMDEEYGSIWSSLRGTHLLFYVLLRVDEAVLPRDGVMDRDLLLRRKGLLLDTVDLYLNRYIPLRLRLFEGEMDIEERWSAVAECMGATAGESGMVDYVRLDERWEMENKLVFDSIIENMLWTRDVPRNYRYDSSYSHYSQFKERMRSRLGQ